MTYGRITLGTRWAYGKPVGPREPTAHCSDGQVNTGQCGRREHSDGRQYEALLGSQGPYLLSDDISFLKGGKL